MIGRTPADDWLLHRICLRYSTGKSWHQYANLLIGTEQFVMFQAKDIGSFYRCWLDLHGGCLGVPAHSTGRGFGFKSDGAGALRARIGQNGQTPQQCAGSYMAGAQAA